MKTYGPTMQCNSKTPYYQMFKMSSPTSGHNSCPQPKSPPINHLINDRLSVNQDTALAYQHVTLPRFCNL